VASRDEIIAFADALLELDRHPDYGDMGLQVVGSAEVRKIACGVSASRELFERAAAAGAELVLVHHGIFWRNEPQRIDARMRGRLETLFAHDISLAAYHLALDAHPELSDSAQLAALLEVEIEAPFETHGVGGRLSAPLPIEAFLARIEAVLERKPLAFAFGPPTVQRVAIMSGGGGGFLVQAAAAGFELFLTGEPTEPAHASARELGVHFVAGGHYATERRGIQAVTRRLAERFDLEWEFLEVESPV
jgi:dinuclear metal center YbgI/SA1388 family protein